MLDGLQRHIYDGLYGRKEADYPDGNLIRFADDIVVTVRSYQRGEEVIRLVKSFVAERGARINEEKTKIVHIDEGFTFLARTYVRKDGHIYAYPSRKAVDRFVSELHELILSHTKSQRDLIKRLNSRLNGWAAYHRFSDAGEAFAEVDTAVQAALLEKSMKQHPKLPRPKVISRYWYKDIRGKHYYALPDDKTVRVIKLSETLLVHHKKIKTNANPYTEREYIENREHFREIHNITGRYKGVWRRQEGKCFYCGKPILVDQPKIVKPIYSTTDPTYFRKVYVHKMCTQSEWEQIVVSEDVSSMTPFDVMNALSGIVESEDMGSKKAPITEQWKYYPLKLFFGREDRSSVTLTFREIEKMLGESLPDSARKDKRFWCRRQSYNSIAESFITEGYHLHHIDLEKGKVTFHRDYDGMSRLRIPPVLLEGKIPDDARLELELFMEYVIDKYDVAERKKRRRKKKS